MNLDEQLKAALDQEAGMRAVPRPDIEGLIEGGRLRRRRRNATRFGAVAAAVVLIGGAAYGVTQTGLGSPRTDPGISDQSTQPSEPTESTTAPPAYSDTDGGPLEPGTYRKLVGHDASGALIEADLTFESADWQSSGQPVISDASARWAGLGVVEPRALAGEPTGCSSEDWGGRSRQPAGTLQALGQQLAQLPRSTVVQPLETAEAFGYDAVHLRLRIDASCPPDQFYLVAEAMSDLGITWSDETRTVIVDFWVVEVDGTVIMVSVWHEKGASSGLIDEANSVRDSINFVTGE